MFLFMLFTIVYLSEITSISCEITDNKKDIEKLKKTYLPEWNDLDTRPLPGWYDKAKIGIFIHWGVYSVPSFGHRASEWFWANWKVLGQERNKMYDDFMGKNYPSNFTYPEFASMFTAEFFDPDVWADLFANAGAMYVVLTSKHHEGFTLFPSKAPYSWNSVDVGPKRDIVRELSTAVRKHNLRFGVYYSLCDWRHPMYYDDGLSKFKTKTYTKGKLWPDVKQLVNDYMPSVLWVDGDWDAREDYWGSQELLAWLYNVSPVKDEVVVNDRWGKGTRGKHGDFYNFEDYFNPGVLVKHKWENAFTLDSQSWGYRRTLKINEVLSVEQLLYQVVSTISCGGNALINVGPTKEGTIIPIFQERLLMLGEWLSINGEAIYGTSPWYHQNDTLNGDVWYTCQKQTYNSNNPIAKPTQEENVLAIYAIVLKWPEGNLLRLKDASQIVYLTQALKIEILGNEGEHLPWTVTNGAVEIQLPSLATLISQHAWTLKFTNT